MPLPRTEGSPPGEVPVEWAARLARRALRVVRGQKPCDYTVLVVPSGGLPDSIGQRAEELLEASQATIGYRARLTRREGEVLQCVLRHEIEQGNRLTIVFSERRREIPRLRSAGEIQGAGSRRADDQGCDWFAAGVVGAARYALRLPHAQHVAESGRARSRREARAGH